MNVCFFIFFHNILNSVRFKEMELFYVFYFRLLQGEVNHFLCSIVLYIFKEMYILGISKNLIHNASVVRKNIEWIFLNVLQRLSCIRVLKNLTHKRQKRHRRHQLLTLLSYLQQRLQCILKFLLWYNSISKNYCHQHKFNLDKTFLIK